MPQNTSIVTINGKQRQASFSERLSHGPVADKFFLSALIAGFFGMPWLGAHMWMMLKGEMIPWQSYAHLKYIHALLQINLFFGLFMTGFVLQAGPKLMQVKKEAPRWLVVFAVLPLLGVLLEYFIPSFFPAKILIVSPFAAAACYIFALMYAANSSNRRGMGIFLAIGLSSLAVGSFFDLSRPDIAVAVFWFGPGSIFLGTSQQFIAGFLGGKRASNGAGIAAGLLYLFAVSALMLQNQGFISVKVAYFLFAVSTLVILIVHLCSTLAYRVFLRPTKTPLSFSFTLGFLWALCGSVYILCGIQHSDTALHLWATGWILPVLIPISAQIISFLSGSRVLRPRTLYTLILLSQLVPAGRGLNVSFGTERWSSWITAAAVSVVFLIWGLRLLKCITVIIRRQFALRKEGKMVQC